MLHLQMPPKQRIERRRLGIVFNCPGSALVRAQVTLSPGSSRFLSQPPWVLTSYCLRMKFSDSNEKTGPARLRVPHRADFLIGGLICAIAALAASFLAAGHSWQVSVPLIFSAVVLLTAIRFGARAGITGTLLAAVIFAVFLFKPLGQLRVASETARDNLVWMMLMGIVFSFLFAPPPPGVHRR